MRCFASRSPRSIRFARLTSCAAFSSGCLPASRRKSWSASVVDSTGCVSGGGGGVAASFSGSSTSSMPRRSSSMYTASTSSGSSSSGSNTSCSSAWRSWLAASAVSSSVATSSMSRMVSISTVKARLPPGSAYLAVFRALGRDKHAGFAKSSACRAEPPDARRRQLEAVAGRIAEVDRPAAAGPFHIGFDLDACTAQALRPGSESVLVFDRKGHMSRTGGSVGRDGPTARGRGRIEDEQHPIATAEEHMPARHLRLELQLEHPSIEVLGGREVGAVEGRLEDVYELSCRSRFHCATSSPLRFIASISRFLCCSPKYRPGNHHLTSRPSAVRLHQQSGSQPQVRLRGLWIRRTTSTRAV